MLDFLSDFASDFMAEDWIEKVGVMGVGLASTIIAIVDKPPPTILHSLIQIIPAVLGVWVAHRSMENAHAVRMERERADREVRIIEAQRKTVLSDRTDTIDLKD